MTNKFYILIVLVTFSVSVSADKKLTEDGKHLFILSGQSNMRNPLPKTFSEAVSQVFGKENVIVVTYAQPSQPIKRWYKNWVPPENVEEKVKPTVLPIPEKLDLVVGYKPDEQILPKGAKSPGRNMQINKMRGCWIGKHNGVYPIYVIRAPNPQVKGVPLREGDVIVGINGQGVRGKEPVDHWREELSKAKKSTRKMSIARWREGTIETVDIDLSEVFKEEPASNRKVKEKKKEVNGTLYDALLQKVKKAIAGKSLKSVTYIWMQGEADAKAGWGSVYEKSFLGVLDQFTNDLALKEINFVLGRINDYWLPANGVKDGDLVRGIQVKLGEEHANGDWVNTDDLNAGVNPWGVYSPCDGHFPPLGYRVMGIRFARKACLLIDPELKPDAEIFDTVYLDSTEQIADHLACGKKISGTKPDSGGSLESLLDGKFGSVNHHDKEWLRFSPDQETVEFVVDLGKPMKVEQIAASILVNQEAKALFPRHVSIQTSKDGEQFKNIVPRGGLHFFGKPAHRIKWLKEHNSQRLLLLVENKEDDVRYVKIRVETGKSWLLVDEIIVNPKAKGTQSDTHNKH